MQTLASVFVSLVVIANTVFPKADLPKVLGVQIASSGSSDSEEVKVESSTSESESEDSKDSETSEQESSTPEPSVEKNSSSSKDFFERSREAFKKSQERIRKTLEIKNENESDSEDENEVEDEDEGSQVSLKKREEFKLKLAEIRNEEKKQKLNELDTNLTKVNQNSVQRWDKVLERLEAIVAKIKTRTDEAAAQGKDVTGILSAVSTAESKISDAKAAVADQSNNAYVIVIGSESNLGQSVKATISTLKTDLKAVEAKVKAAKDAVKDLFSALKLVVGSSDATPSATPTI